MLLSKKDWQQDYAIEYAIISNCIIQTCQLINEIVVTQHVNSVVPQFDWFIHVCGVTSQHLATIDVLWVIMLITKDQPSFVYCICGQRDATAGRSQRASEALAHRATRYLYYCNSRTLPQLCNAIFFEYWTNMTHVDFWFVHLQRPS